MRLRCELSPMVKVNLVIAPPCLPLTAFCLDDESIGVAGVIIFRTRGFSNAQCKVRILADKRSLPVHRDTIEVSDGERHTNRECFAEIETVLKVNHG